MCYIIFNYNPNYNGYNISMESGWMRLLGTSGRGVVKNFDTLLFQIVISFLSLVIAQSGIFDEDGLY